MHQQSSDGWHQETLRSWCSRYQRHCTPSCGCSNNLIKRTIRYLFVSRSDCSNDISSIDLTLYDLTVSIRICTGRSSLCNTLIEKSVCLTTTRKSMSTIKLNIHPQWIQDHSNISNNLTGHASKRSFWLSIQLSTLSSTF